MSRDLVVVADRAAVVRRVAEDACKLLADALRRRPVAHLALTGGTVGIGVLNELGHHFATAVEWERVHLWWSDERWVPATSSDRNDLQAELGFLSKLPFDVRHVHRMPAADSGLSLEEAARAYEATLAIEFGDDLPVFDLALLGVGPDAHIASLFPGESETLREATRWCLPIVNSPKQPPERLSLTLPVINASREVWVVAAGADKADAVARALGDQDLINAPVSAVNGVDRTRIYCDAEAARN